MDAPEVPLDEWSRARVIRTIARKIGFDDQVDALVAAATLGTATTVAEAAADRDAFGEVVDAVVKVRSGTLVVEFDPDRTLRLVYPPFMGRSR